MIGTDRASVRYQGVRPDDVALRERLKALAQERRRFGYRRLHVLLRREGHAVNKKRVQRLYREERLTVRRRGGRKRALGTRRPMVMPLAADQRWSLDFVSDQLTDGRRFRILAIVAKRNVENVQVKMAFGGVATIRCDRLSRSRPSRVFSWCSRQAKRGGRRSVGTQAAGASLLSASRTLANFPRLPRRSMRVEIRPSQQT